MAKVTVVIPFFNRKNLLPKAIRSVFRQTYQDWKLILVDDCSTDDYLPAIEQHLNDPRVRLIRNTKNLGQSKSLNNALEIVDTPFLVQLDSDDWYYSSTLEILVKEAEKQPNDVAVICGNLKVVWEDSVGKIIRGKLKRGRPFTDRYEFLMANTNIVPRFYRTSALRKIGGWPTNDPYEGRYREDMLILYRLIPHFRFHWINKPLYIQRVHGNNLTNRNRQLQKTVEWSVNDALSRWGNEYKANFCIVRGGWKKVRKLIPILHKKGRYLLKINPLSADEMRRLVRSSIQNKTSLCLTSLANVNAREEAILLKNSRFWKLLEGKKIVFLSKWSEGFANQFKPISKRWNIRISGKFPVSDKTSASELVTMLNKVKYDIAFVSTDFNAVNLCKIITNKHNKIVVDIKDGMQLVVKGKLSLPTRKR